MVILNDLILSVESSKMYGKQDQQGKVVFNERNPLITQQQGPNKKTG
jgi:hypothetical protein